MIRTVLLVGKDNIEKQNLYHILKSDYTVIGADNSPEALKLLDINQKDVSAVMIDGTMDGEGQKLISTIRDSDILSLIPVVLVSDKSEQETEKDASLIDADDFITKPYDGQVLKRRLRILIKSYALSQSLDILQKDKLTDIWSREVFYEKAAQAIRKKPENYYILSCLDIDNFKIINDRYGTDVGDGVIKALASTLCDICVKGGGICGRITADNFVLIYPKKSLDDGQNIIQTLKRGISKKFTMSITISAGRYIVDDKNLPVSAMYDRANIAKTTVKGRYDTHIAIYNESMRSVLVQRQEIVNSMNTALALKQYEVWFQPQYNHETGALVGAEALARWRHPTRGFLSPNEFIPVFESNGFIYELDKFIWEQVCILLRKWLDGGKTAIPVSVNISRYDLFREDLVSCLVSLVHLYEIPESLLRLEITESAFSQSTEQLIAVVHKLMALGFTVEIDDFGSGYSSLNILKDVAAHSIKLDMRFLESASDGKRSGNILESIIRMARWIDMAVIAEGVETKEQADYLKSIGCVYVQGGYYGKPMPAAEYETLAYESTVEERLARLETVQNLNQSSFWDPKSLDSFIFNNYVGAASIIEYAFDKFEVIRVTDKFMRTIGNKRFTISEALKLDWNLYLDTESARVFAEAIKTSTRINDEVTCECLFINLPGCPEKTYLRSSLRVIAVSGDRYLVYCISVNITEEKEARSSEISAYSQLRTMINNVSSGVSAVKYEQGKFKYLYANKQYYSLFGYTEEQFHNELPGGLTDAVIPENVGFVSNEILTEISTGKTSPFEFRARRRDGRVVNLRCSGTACEMARVDGAVYISVITDITSETRAKEKTSLKAKRIAEITDNINCGVSAFSISPDEKTQYYFANTAYYEMYGYTKEQFENKSVNFHALVYEDDLQYVKDAIDRVIKTQKPENIKYRCKKQNGEILSVNVFLSIIYLDSTDDPVIVSVTYNDGK